MGGAGVGDDDGVPLGAVGRGVDVQVAREGTVGTTVGIADGEGIPIGATGD